MSAASRGTVRVRNGGVVALGALPPLEPDEFRAVCGVALTAGGRLVALPAFALGTDDGRDVFAVIANDDESELTVTRTRLARGAGFDALTPEFPEAQAFERELFEDHGIIPVGHPWLKPLRQAHLKTDAAQHTFFSVDGDGIHEVAVGPVHAGVIEPGHFRFQCAGEDVLHLEIHLGYQHRGAERLLVLGSPARRIAVAESIAGDTAVGHALAYAHVIESLAGVRPPLAAQTIRGLALELERVANHVGDLGALANDVAFLPAAAWFGRLRGEFLNLLMALSGNRYGRGLVVTGGVRFGLPSDMRQAFTAKLAETEADLRATAETLFSSPSVSSRFEQTGVVSDATAEDLGLVGVVARASHVARDARRDHPIGIYRFVHIPLALAETGDVMARAVVRWIEVQRSLTFLREQIAELAEGPLRTPSTAADSFAPDSLAVALIEGWRGEIAHVAATNGSGDLRGYKVVDPSFHNWFGLAMALRDNAISDFPLCNKSFNLSYAGHDL
ncbi:MAG: hydrogenase [Deltaproteobacteria bacterium]|nr:hydrogenase [Deltaproteobacteria bacterium]